MTRYLEPDPGFDPRIADWLEADPVDAPGQVLETVLAAYPSIPQRRAMRLPRRFPIKSRFAYLAAAATAAIAVTAVVGGGLLSSPQPSGGPSVPVTGSTGPSASPTAGSPEPSATPEPTARPSVSAMWTVTGNMVEI